ncbi:hypothetical protein LIA77_09317 [Sarocladium implicatum]|nr:hypothetical protein LIA77_09317 [Sarocladium implicatum]
MPTLEDLTKTDYKYNAPGEKYWWEVTSKNTKENDYSPSFFLGGDGIYYLQDENFDPAAWTSPNGKNRRVSSTSLIVGQVPRTTLTSAASTFSSDAQETGKSVDSKDDDGTEARKTTEGREDAGTEMTSDISEATNAKETSNSSRTGTFGSGGSGIGEQNAGQGPGRTSTEGPDPTSEVEENDGGLDGESKGMPTAVYAGIGAGAGIGGILIVGVVIWLCMRKRRQAKNPEVMSDVKMPPELDDAGTKKAELAGGEVFEKGDGEGFVAELPVGAYEEAQIHGDGRYGGRSEMAG